MSVALDSDGLPRVVPTCSDASWTLCDAVGPPLAAAVETGTTIVACCYSGGVVLGADTRTSAGSYVVNRAARKITKLSDRICVCRSGSAADTQAVAQIARLQTLLYAQELPRQFKGQARVSVVAHLLQQLCFDYKDQLTAGLIVGGWDPVDGPQAFSIPIGGACIPVQYTAGGSGSVFITAFLDENFRPGLSKQEALQLVTKAVGHAISRDGSSGGMIRLVTIEKEGMEEFCIEGNQLPVEALSIESRPRCKEQFAHKPEKLQGCTFTFRLGLAFSFLRSKRLSTKAGEPPSDSEAEAPLKQRTAMTANRRNIFRLNDLRGDWKLVGDLSRGQ
ncbi:hypothetical protein Efla_003202 [Eimeria flavescens]